MEVKALFVGAKFYKHDEDGNLEIIRIVRRKSDNVYIIIKNNDFSQTYTRTSDELLKYTMLKSDAIFNFTIVINGDDGTNQLKDVIVTMARKSDKTEPYVVCRQMMNNIFTQFVTNDIILGNCISQDTLPPGMKFSANLMCNSVVKNMMVHGYLDDTPDIILRFATRIIRQADKFLKDQKKVLESKYKGLCSSVEELLRENLFWGDVDKGLKITKLNDKIENSSLNLEQLTYLEKEISYLMDNVTVIKYASDIDFSKIKSDYMLIRDLVNDLYLVSYLRGTFIQQEHLSSEELEKFSSIKI